MKEKEGVDVKIKRTKIKSEAGLIDSQSLTPHKLT